MGISHTRPAPFNFLNGTGMRIVFNKRGGVGMGVTRLIVIPTVFLVFLFFIYRVDEIFAVIGEEMHVGLSWTCLYGKKERSATTMNPSKILQTTRG